MALGLPILAACGADEAIPPERATLNTPTAMVATTTIPSTRAVAGTVVSSNVSPLSAKVIGNVTRVLVNEGDRVRAGQLLVEIDSREGKAGTEQARAGSVEIERAIDAARANATLADATLKRYTALFERRSVSAQEFDDVKARAAGATAELARLEAKRGEVRAMATQAQTFLDYSSIRSPIDGVVTRRFVDPGAQAAPGMPLVTVEDTRTYRVEATLPDEVRVRPGDPVTIEIGGAHVQGRIPKGLRGVEPTGRRPVVMTALGGDPARRAGAPYHDAANPAIRSGAYARVLVPVGERAAITVPPTAIVRRGQLTSVFVVGTDGVARMRLVTLGEDNEVLSGLDAGERIVIDGAKAADGAKIV